MYWLPLFLGGWLVGFMAYQHFLGNLEIWMGKIMTLDGVLEKMISSLPTFFNGTRLLVTGSSCCGLPGRRSRHAVDEDNVLLKWLVYSPDLTHCYFFLLGYVKILSYVSILSITREELKLRITTLQETSPQTCCCMFGKSWTINLTWATLQAGKILKPCKTDHDVYTLLN